MISALHIPKDPLCRYINYMYYYAGYMPEHQVDRFLPDGEVQLIIDLTDKPKYIYDNDTFREVQACRYFWFSGFRTKPITIPSGRESEMLIIQFKRGQAPSFLNVPMYELTNQVVDADLVMSAELKQMRYMLLESSSPEEKFSCLETQLIKIFRKRLGESPFINFVLDRIHNRTIISVADIVSETGYSQKHFIELFKRQVGVTPKEYIRICRFQQVISRIDKLKPLDWLSVAYDCGFYDQSHFIAEFKKFSGLTPTEYVARKGDLLHYIPMDPSR